MRHCNLLRAWLEETEQPYLWGAGAIIVGRRGTYRILTGAALTWFGVTAAVGLTAAPAHADGVEQVTVTGEGLVEPLEVRADEAPERFAALYREVSFLIGESPDADEPDPNTLGPQYTLVTHVDGAEHHRFELYPLAAGGPRVFRPKEQPNDRKVREGWFHGRLSMPETLTAVGLPLDGDPSGVGGGALAPEPTATAGPGVLGLLDDWREGMQLTIAVTIAIAAGLAGVALLIRRKV